MYYFCQNYVNEVVAGVKAQFMIYLKMNCFNQKAHLHEK